MSPAYVGISQSYVPVIDNSDSPSIVGGSYHKDPV